jgi:hypothetical protein
MIGRTLANRTRNERASKKASKVSKPYWEMSARELAAATRQFDAEGVFEKAKPLSPLMRARLARAKRKRGRPKTGLGAKVVAISIERGLLKASDALAKRRKMTRAQLVAEGLRAVLARAG